MILLGLWHLKSAGKEYKDGWEKTCRLVFEALDYGKSSWIKDILHHKPINCLFILPVDSCSLDQLCLDAGYGVGMIVRVLDNVTGGQEASRRREPYQMNRECIDHRGGLILDQLRTSVIERLGVSSVEEWFCREPLCGVEVA